MRNLLAAAYLLASSPLIAAAPQRRVEAALPRDIARSAAPEEEASGLLAGALIEALAAIKKPELSGIFTYVGEANAPRAFADLVARDPKAMKLYVAKLMADLKAAGGTTAWDHEVCATLVNYYAGPAIAGLKKPNAKRLKAFNDGVLSPVKELQDIVSQRNR